MHSVVFPNPGGLYESERGAATSAQKSFPFLVNDSIIKFTYNLFADVVKTEKECNNQS